MSIVVKILTAIATILAIGWGIWQRYFSRAAKIRNLEGELLEIEQMQQEALERNDMLLYYSLDRRRWMLVKQLRNIR